MESSSSFDFIPDRWSHLRAAALRVEATAQSNPDAALQHVQDALERTVDALYQREWNASLPANGSLYDVFEQPRFRYWLADQPADVHRWLHDLWKQGRKGAHPTEHATPEDAQHALRTLQQLLRWFVNPSDASPSAPVNAPIHPPVDAPASPDSSTARSRSREATDATDERSPQRIARWLAHIRARENPAAVSHAVAALMNHLARQNETLLQTLNAHERRE